jgi:putative ABC transport system permease protein
VKSWHNWRAALRIARRDAMRAKGRSILVIAMIALPILGVSAADITIRTSQLTAEEELDRKLGVNDARFEDFGEGGPIKQGPDPTDISMEDEVGPPGGSEPISEEERAGINDLLPDAEVLSWTTTEWLDVTTANGVMSTGILEFDTSHPNAEGLPTLRSGAFPTGPGEIAATEEFLDESGLKIGDEVTIADLGEEPAYRIVGAYEHPDHLDQKELLAQPGEMIAPLKEAGVLEHTFREYLVTAPDGVPWSQIVEVNKQGWRVLSREVYLNPPPDSEVPLFTDGHFWAYDEGIPEEAIVVVVTTVALVMLEICLLAGPAFAVGARRSRRMLGLVGANGGDRRHIRAIMLSSGLVLGAAAAVVGVTLGVLLMMLSRPWLEDLGNSRFGSLTVRPLELLAIVALGVFTGLMAALIPAITAARSPVLDSLTGRRGVRGTGRVLPLLGGSAFLLGAGLAIFGGMTIDNTTIVAIGAILAQLGLVAMTPMLVGVFGKVGRWLPLSGRLALRDAVRNRSRTAPAVAAVLAAVSGTIAVATIVASDAAKQREEYEANQPHGTVVLQAYAPGQASGLDAARQAVAQHLKVDERADFSYVTAGETDCGVWGDGEECGSAMLRIPPENVCDWDKHHESTEAFRQTGRPWSEYDADWRCGWGPHSMPFYGDVAVAGPELLTIMELDHPEAVAALQRGEAVVFDRTQINADGEITVDVYLQNPHNAPDFDWDEYERTGELPPADHTTTFPAMLYGGDKDDDDAVAAGGNDFSLPTLVSPEAAQAAGLETAEHGSMFSTTEVPGGSSEQALRAALKELGSGAPEFYIENGFEKDTGLILLALALFATVVTLGAAGIATGLAQADSEADLATLAAVGAPPRVRRTLSGLQCAVIAGMGVVLGTISGVIPGVGLLLAQHRADLADYERWGDPFGDLSAPQLIIEVPWMTAGQLLIVVPLLAGVLAALLTRSRIGLTRRAG